MKKTTYVLGNNINSINHTKYSKNEEFMDNIFYYTKEWVNEAIHKLNLTPLDDDLLEAYIGLNSYKHLNIFRRTVDNGTYAVAMFYYKYKNMRSLLCDSRNKDIEISIRSYLGGSNAEYYNNKFCFFVDVTNKATNKNEIVPLNQKGLSNLIALIFTDRFLNEGNPNIEEANNNANLLYFKDKDERFTVSGGHVVDSTLSNALDALSIKSQDEVKNIVVNKIVDVGPVNVRRLKRKLSISPIRAEDEYLIDNELIERVSNVREDKDEMNIISFNESLGLHEKIGVDLLEVIGVSNDLLSILDNEYEAFKSLRRLNMLDSHNQYGKVSFNVKPLLESTIKFYCKKCRKNSIIPAIVSVKNSIMNEFKCPVCGEVHTIGNDDELEKPYFLNATVFDEIETEGKIKFRTRCCSYAESHGGIYYKSVSQGFTYNLKTNRAFMYNSANKSFCRVSDIGAFNVFYLNETVALGAANAFKTDSEGNVIVKLDKLKQCFYHIYDLLSSHIDIKFSEEEVLEISMNNLRNAKSLVDSDLVVSPLLSTSAERNDTVNKINNERMYFNAMKILGEMLKDNTKSREYFEIMGISNNYLTSYIHKASQKNGKYLTNKFKMSNSIRKEVMKRPWKIANYILFRNAITDVNNMKKLLELDITNEGMIRLISSFTDTMEEAKSWCKSFKLLDYISKSFGDLIIPLKALYKDESTFVNRLLTNSFDDITYYLRDTCRMLNRVQEGDAGFNFDSKFKLKRLHDELSSADRKLKRANRLISFDEHEEVLECSNDRYSISLARETHRLIDLGVNLNICVGSYDTRAVDKNCTILYITDKFNKNKDVCCVEIRRPVSSFIEGAKVRFDLHQTKTYSNNRPTNELREFLLGWIKENKINISTTYDIEFGDENVLEEGETQYYNNNIANF